MSIYICLFYKYIDYLVDDFHDLPFTYSYLGRRWPMGQSDTCLAFNWHSKSPKVCL